MSSPRSELLLAVLLSSTVAACGGGGESADAAARIDASGGELADAPTGDGGAPVDGGSPSDGGGGSCEPTSGSMTSDAFCDFFELALFTSGGATEARLHGRMNGLPEGACAVIDEVEVQEGGATIGTLAGAGSFTPGDERALLARGPALAPMTARCSSDEGRFGGFGLIVRGRVDGGSFEARCADAEGGSRWPPALRVTCHENVDRQAFSAYAEVRSFPGATLTSLSASMPHGPGGAITAVDPTARVIGHASSAFGGPMVPAPFDLTGLVTNVSESSGPVLGPYSSLSMSAPDDPFGTILCPTPTMPGPMSPPPPVMLVRLTGTSEHGPFRSEVYIAGCSRLSM